MHRFCAIEANSGGTGMWNDLDAILSLTVGFIGAIVLVLLVLSFLEDDLVTNHGRKPVTDPSHNEVKQLGIDAGSPEDR